MKNFKSFLIESAADRYEIDVANYINSMENMNAERPKVSSKYSDIKVSTVSGKGPVWLEVKMNHSDNLGNTRCFYDGRVWKSSSNSPLAVFCVNILNKSRQAKDFLQKISEFSGIKNPKLPTTLGGLKDKNAVPLSVMKEYFEQPDVNRYIVIEPNIDIGKLTTEHYLKGKAEPAYYMQAGDDFYLIGKTNPLGLPKNIPLVAGIGNFKMRVSTRSRFYEIQPEVKILKMVDSPYSVKPNTLKKNPFQNI